MLKDQSKLKLLLCIIVMIMHKISSFVSNLKTSVKNGRKTVGQLKTVEIVISFIFI